MAQIEKLKKSFEILKQFTSHSPKPPDKTLLPVKYLRQENIIDKKECLKNCEIIANILVSYNFRNHPDFNRFLSQSIELWYILSNNDDTDIRNAVNEAFDKLIFNLNESHSYRLLSEFCKGIISPTSNRALRLSMLKFSEICHKIRPNKFRAYAANLYPNFIPIIGSKDEMLQESLYLCISKVFPILTAYATAKEILDILNAYLFNLSSSSNTIRRFSSLSMAVLCDSTRKPDYYFNVAFNYVTNYLSLVKPEEKDLLLSGIFVFAKCSFSKVFRFFDAEDCKDTDLITKILSFIYEQIISTIKYGTSNILIISALEALIEFFNTMPPKTFQMFNDICDSDVEFKSVSLPTYNLKTETIQTTNPVDVSVPNLEKDDLKEESFQKSSIFFNSVDLGTDEVLEVNETTFENDYSDSSEVFFDQESEMDTRSVENKTMEFDTASEVSSINASQRCPQSPFDSTFDFTENLCSIDFDEYNLGKKFSYEYTAKLVCLKYLLKGQDGELLTDSEVRVSIKSLALSCMASIISLCPKILFDRISCKETSQPIQEVLLFLNHSDPNIRGHVTLIIGKYLGKILSNPLAYDEFLIRNNSSNNLTLDHMLSLLVKSINDSSSITIKYVLVSFQQFLPSLLSYNEVNLENIFDLLYDLLSLKNSSYWLVKVELINLFSMLSFKHLKYFEHLLNSTNSCRLGKVSTKKPDHLCNISISKIVMEEILFDFLYDNDHRIRQASLEYMPNFIQNLCLNDYVFHNDSINLLVQESMSLNFSYDVNLKSFDYEFSSDGMFDSDYIRFHPHYDQIDLRSLTVQSNLTCFIKKFLYELRHKFYLKSSVVYSIIGLSFLSKSYPPSKHMDGWMIDFNNLSDNTHNIVQMVHFLIELLTKNPIVVVDLTLQQNLIELIIDLIQTICASFCKTLQDHQNYGEKIDSGLDLCKIISPSFVSCIEFFFLHLYKIIVIYSSINGENISILINFIHHLHTKNASIAAMMKKQSSSFFEIKEKDLWNKKPEPSSSHKGLRRREANSYDSVAFKLYELLKNCRYRKAPSHSGKCDKASFFNTVLNSFAKLLEFIRSSFLSNHLEDILIYLKMIFFLNPCAITLVVRKLLKCIFEINYTSMFIEVFNSENIKKNPDMAAKLFDFKSFHNICCVIPYMQFNHLFQNSNIDKMSINFQFTPYLSWLRKWIEMKHMKIMNSDITNSDDKINLFNLKKFLTLKIQCFEPLVILSMKHYTITSDAKFQSQILDLLVQLIQFHINYSLLDSENIFIAFIMKQFEYMESIHNSESFRPLMKHVFHFLSTISREHYISEKLVNTPRIIQLCDDLIANNHQQLAIDGLYIVIDHLFYSDFDTSTSLPNSEYQIALETQREVILAYCFKLIRYRQTFHLLTLILNHYRNRDRTKWDDLSKQIYEIIINKLMINEIRIESIDHFKSLQSLIFFLCPNIFSRVSDTIELMFKEYDCRKSSSSIPFKHWLPKLMIYLKIILSNLDETFLLSSTDRIKEKLNIINLNPNESADCFEKINSEDVFAYFLLNLLQKIVMEIENDLMNGNVNNEDLGMCVYFLRYYQLVLAFLFQSGFYPKLTKSAISLLKQTKADISLNNEIFDLKIVNEIFMKFYKFYPIISISWLNFLFILNYDKLSKNLSKCIEKKSLIEINGKHVSTINLEILKRSSLILLCDYLSENLENVEFLSWFIINHLKDIIQHCHEIPIKEFINSIHRKPVSSGLLLQIISSRFDELLSGPIMANKILYCLERSHGRQNLALIMFLLEKYLFNQKLTIYYKCCKYAESIIITRLNSIYDTNHKSVPLFNSEDFLNLLEILKHTSYNKLYFTVKKIRIKFYDNVNGRKQSRITCDPLRKKQIIVPEIDKNWFLKLMEAQMSQRQKLNSCLLNSLEKLSNQDIVNLIFSDKFSLKNLDHILKLIVVSKRSKKIKLSSTFDFDRNHLAKLINPIYIRSIQLILEKYPLNHYFEENKIISQKDSILTVYPNEFLLNLFHLLLPSFDFFTENLSFFLNHSSCDEESFSLTILRMMTLYSTLIYKFQMEQNYHKLISVLKIIENSLNNQNLYLELCDEKNIYLQLTLIKVIYFTFKHYYLLDKVHLPSTFKSINRFGITLEDCEKLISLFHSLEKRQQALNCVGMKNHEVPLYGILLEKIILKISRFPLFNSLIYIPFNLFISKNEHIWNGTNLEQYPNVPITPSQFLCEPDVFKQFLFRVANLGFIDRRQFEEIWMTLLGVLSESFSLISQHKQTEELIDFLVLSKLVIIAITNLLYNAESNSSIDNVGELNHEKESSNSFGPRFQLIKETIDRKSQSFDKILKLFNEPILNRSFIYKLKSIKECKFENINLIDYSSEREIVIAKTQASIDLYSCIQFLIEFYCQQIKPFILSKNIYFPIVYEIAKSSLIISEIFVDKNQYKKVLELFNDLQKIVENYDDEILNQFFSVGFCKFYSIFSTIDDLIEKQKKIIIERNFKEFFLPTRIHSIQCIQYLVESRLIKLKDLPPILDYITKHLSTEHVIPSSYCKEYVEKLVYISFFLLDSYPELISNNSDSDQSEKIIKGLIKLNSKDLNISIIKTLNYCFEQLIRERKIGREDANLLRNIALKKLNTTTNQSYTVHMLNLIVCASYFVGSTNFDLETITAHHHDDNDELFKILEKLSIIFEPLKRCNSLDASILCQVLGYFLPEFFPAQDILNKCIGEFISKQQNHYKYLINILYIIYNELQVDYQKNDTAQDWVILSLSSFTQLVPVSHALWALTCFLICASQNHWIRSCYFYFQNRFGKFTEEDKQAFFCICQSFYNEIKSDENKMSFIKTFQRAACLPNSPYFEVIQYLCDI